MVSNMSRQRVSSAREIVYRCETSAPINYAKNCVKHGPSRNEMRMERTHDALMHPFAELFELDRLQAVSADGRRIDHHCERSY